MIVYQGVKGAYSHLACQHVFPQREATACETFIEAMQAVEQGHANLAMIPVENSTAGRVEEIYRLIPKMSLHIVGEHYLDIQHHLMTLPNQAIEAISEVHSHPMALLQCKEFFKRYPHIKLVESKDTAESAKYIGKEKLAGVY